MATRGTGIIITNETVNFGPSFNGDMHPTGFGLDFFFALNEVQTDVDFIKLNNSFNKMNFNYEKIMSRYQGKIDFDELSTEGVLDFNKVFKVTTDDWSYMKNLSDKTIELKLCEEKQVSIELHPGETAKFNFLRYIGKINNENVERSYKQLYVKYKA